MGKNIILSPKHGVNPTIPVCFFCGHEKNEIALLGRLKDDAEAPRHIILDTEPCDECKAFMDQGYTMLGVVDHPVITNQQPIAEGQYLSRNFIVLSEQGVRNILNPDTVESVLKDRSRRFLAADEIVLALKAQFDALQNQEESEIDTAANTNDSGQ